MAAMIRARLTKTSRELGVDDEVEVALAVARLDVGQAVELFGQRAQRLWKGTARRRAAAKARRAAS